MKNLLLAFLLLPLTMAAQTSVQFKLTDPQFGISFTTNVEIVLQAEGVNLNGTVTLLPITLYAFTDTNGQYTFTNLAAATTLPAYYHWTVPANSNPQGNGPPQTYQGDIIITSTNLGLVSATSITAGNGPTYPYGSGWAWSAQASDLRYSASTSSLASYVQIGQLNSASNAIVAQIPSTNGFITTNALAGLASTIYANGLTNNFTSIVSSNPATAFTTPTQVTNLINSLATTNGVSSATVTNIADARIYAASNSLSTNFVAQIGAATNGAASTNWVNGQGYATTLYVNTVTNFYTPTNVFLARELLNQPASATFSNIDGKFINTNRLANLDGSIAITTNIGGNTTIISWVPQTNVPAGLVPWVGLQPSSYLQTNTLPGLTNGFISTTAGLLAATSAAAIYYPLSNPSNYTSVAGLGTYATTNFVRSYADTNGAAAAAVQAASGAYQPSNSTLSNLANTGAFTNKLANQDGSVTLTTNFSGNTTFISAVPQTFLTNGLISSAQSAANIAAATAGMVSNSSTFNVTLGASLAFTNGSSQISGGTLGFAKWRISNGSGSVTFDNGQFTSDGQGNIYANTFNGSGGLLNDLNYNSITNPPLWQAVTNGFAQGFFGLGTKTNFLITTNVIGINGNATVAGTYIGANGLWTNQSSAVETILASGGLYFIISNGVTLYQSGNVQTWSTVSGVNPVPVGDFGSIWNVNGVQFVGLNLATNTTTGGTTNFNLSGFIIGPTTNTLFSAAATNTIIQLIGLYSTSPTNGVSTNALQAILISSNYAFFTYVTNAIIVTSNALATAGAVTTTTVSNIANSLILPATNTTYAAGTNYANALVVAATNGLASLIYVNTATNGFVSKSVTNGFAQVPYVTNAIIVTSNGLASAASSGYIAKTNGSGESLSLTHTVGPGFAALNLFATNAGAAMYLTSGSDVMDIFPFYQPQYSFEFAFGGTSGGVSNAPSALLFWSFSNLTNSTSGNPFGMFLKDANNQPGIWASDAYFNSASANGATIGTVSSTNYLLGGVPLLSPYWNSNQTAAFVSGSISSNQFIANTNGRGYRVTLTGSNLISGAAFFIASITNAYNATNVNAILTAFSLTNAGGSSAFCNGTYTFQDGLAGTTSATWTNVGGVVCDYNASYGWQIHNNVALCYTNAAPGPSPYPFPATYSDAGLYNNPELSPAIASYIWTTNVVLTTNILTQTQIAVNTNNPSTNAASIVGSLNIVGSIWLNGTNLAASVTSNVNATNVNFIAGTGTIYTAPGGSNSFSINPILVATNNEAAMFCATNGLTGPGELFDLSLAVQSEKNYGAWTSLVQASIYRVNFAPSNHIALVGNPWSVSNEVFGTWGARDNGTNQYFTPLPTAISNYCVSICYQVDVSAGNNAQMGIGQALLSTYNTNTLDSTLMILPSSQGPRLVSSSGSTFNGGFVAEMFPMQSGVWADNFRAFPADPTVVTYSVSNGWLRAFVNGNVAIFNTLGTNVVFNTNYTAALNALVIGNGGPAWSALGGVTRVAGYSEHSVVLIHNVPWEANPNIPKADFAFGRCLEKPTLLFVGASRLNYRTSFNNVPSQGMPLTNDPVTLYQQISPEVCVLENAYPGNSVSQYANMGGTYGGRYAYIPPIVYLPWQKCAGFFTDAGGNDVLFGYGISAALASFNGFWNQYSNIAPFTLFARGSDNLYYTNSALLPTYYRQQLQSFPFANFVNEGAYLTSNWLAHVSQETNAEHVGNGVGIVYYDAVKDTVIHWKTGKQPNVFGYNDATAAVPNSTVPFSQMKFVMRDTNNLELLTLDGSTLTNISGGGGSSALPASTNNIWNLTNSANTLAGTLSGSLNGVTGSIGTITMTGGSTLTGGNINSGNGTFSGTVTASNYVTAGYSPGTIFLDTNYWGYGSTANYSGNRTNDIFQITIHCTGGLPADHATFLTNVFGVTYGDIPLVDVAPYGDSTRILGYQGGPIGVTSASQTNVVVGIYGAYTPGPGTYILNFKVNR